MKIKVYSNPNEYNYIVQIGNSVFEMSTNANMPNGANMYCGEELQINTANYKDNILGDLPKGILVAIIQRLQEKYNLER